MTALSKIKNAGFDVSLFGDKFRITPADKLTMQQCEFLKSHKAEIMNELIMANRKAEQTAVEIISKFVTCYSPSGLVYEVDARDEQHSAFLQKMNPKRLNYGE
jgi:hypothetical protein